MNAKLRERLATFGWVLVIVLLAVLLGRIWQRDKKNEVKIPESDWAKLMLVLQSVERDYVDEIDQKAVTEQILPELMAKLDPHSLYLPPVELEEAEQDLQGGFDGIGIQFNVPNDTAVVTHVIAGGPSEKAGLLSGDRIVQVDDRVIAGTQTPQDSMVRLMKGKRGSQVRIYVQRTGVKDPIQFNITRDVIPVNSVDVAFMLNDTTGYIKLSKFARMPVVAATSSCSPCSRMCAAISPANSTCPPGSSFRTRAWKTCRSSIRSHRQNSGIARAWAKARRASSDSRSST